MKSITMSYAIVETKTFPIPTSGEWKTFFDIWEKSEDDRTDEEWDFIERYSLEDFLKANGIHGYEIDVNDWED